MSTSRVRPEIPRPGAPAAPVVQDAIPGPSEAAFTDMFGALLPPAQYLRTRIGKAAYYELTRGSCLADDGPIDRVLVLHGVQTPALGMLPLAGALQRSFPGARLVLVDLWGHGLSDTPLVAHSPGLFHELVDALLERLGWPAAHLVGYSFGAMLTAGYVAVNSGKVRSLTLVAPAGMIRSEAFPAAGLARLRGGDGDAARRWVMEFLEGEGGDIVVPRDWEERVKRGEVVAEAVRAWQVREHPGHMASVVAMIRDGGAMDNHDAFDGASRTGVASLVVLGERDDVCTEADVRGLGFNNVVVLPDVGHGVVRDRAAEVAAQIGAFWQSWLAGRC